MTGNALTNQEADASQCDLLIRNAYVITMDSDRRIFPNGTVAVTGSLIVDVGDDAELASRYRAARTIDAKGGVVHPGMIDCHVHIGQTGGRGCIPDGVTVGNGYSYMRAWMGSLEADDEYSSTLLSSLEMLRNGTTFFVEPGTVFEPDAVASAAERIGIRGSLADPYLWDVDSARAVKSSFDKSVLEHRAPVSRARARKLLGQQLRRNSDPDALVRGHIGLYGAGSASDELLREASTIAAANGAIWTQHQNYHCADVQAEDEDLGKHALIHQAEIGVLGPHCLFAHMNFVRDDEISVVLDSGLAIVWSPGVYLKYGIGATTRPRIPELYRKGVRVAIATDTSHPWAFGDAGLLSYLVARSFEDFVSVESVLEMLTISAAEALGVADRLGSLAVGKRADIVIRRHDLPEAYPKMNVVHNLMLISRGKSVDTVLVNGKVVVQHGHATCVNEAEVYEMADASARRVMKKLSLAIKPRWRCPSC
ncbi:5-methylthioadenosine/S-adenosylhomocysteine deaminase [Bradyrhizobium sp. i1.8.4]|uniref:amidohydrolase family protein n=1 Tax=unclassified Bradyrhizobium TaxID=2631580 RepID=UPI003D246F35